MFYSGIYIPAPPPPSNTEGFRIPKKLQEKIFLEAKWGRETLLVKPMVRLRIYIPDSDWDFEEYLVYKVFAEFPRNAEFRGNLEAMYGFPEFRKSLFIEI